MQLNPQKDWNICTETKENETICTSIVEIMDKFLALEKQYRDSYSALTEEAESKIHYREYARGCRALHRGFYSPTALDLVCGGTRRGRIAKIKPKKDAYEYCFDKEGNLICAKEYNTSGEIISTEVILHNQGKSTSFSYWPDATLYFLTECTYENGIVTRYEAALLGCKNPCSEINVESFEYADGVLKTLDWYRYTPSIQLLSHERYQFERDETGRLSTYTVTPMHDLREKTTSQELVKYKVLQVNLNSRIGDGLREPSCRTGDGSLS